MIRDAQSRECGKVIQCSAPGNKLVCDFAVPIRYPNRTVRVQPVIAPNLRPFALPAYPTSQQIGLICVDVVIDRFPIDKSAELIGYSRTIRVARLHSEMEFFEPWKVRHIETGNSECAARRAQRARVVVNDRIGVEREPRASESSVNRKMNLPLATPRVAGLYYG